MVAPAWSVVQKRHLSIASAVLRSPLLLDSGDQAASVFPRGSISRADYITSAQASRCLSLRLSRAASRGSHLLRYAASHNPVTLAARNMRDHIAIG